MSDPPSRSTPGQAAAKYQTQREGLLLLAGIVGLMWLVEVVDTLDSYGLDSDGIWPRSFGHLWAIFTAPFLHANFHRTCSTTRSRSCSWA